MRRRRPLRAISNILPDFTYDLSVLIHLMSQNAEYNMQGMEKREIGTLGPTSGAREAERLTGLADDILSGAAPMPGPLPVNVLISVYTVS